MTFSFSFRTLPYLYKKQAGLSFLSYQIPNFMPIFSKNYASSGSYSNNDKI